MRRRAARHLPAQAIMHSRMRDWRRASFVSVRGPGQFLADAREHELFTVCVLPY